MPKLIITGMTCGHCAQHVQRAVSNVAGVTSVTVNLERGEAEVQGNPDAQAVLTAVEEEGYGATWV